MVYGTSPINQQVAVVLVPVFRLLIMAWLSAGGMRGLNSYVKSGQTGARERKTRLVTSISLNYFGSIPLSPSDSYVVTGPYKERADNLPNYPYSCIQSMDKNSILLSKAFRNI